MKRQATKKKRKSEDEDLRPYTGLVLCGLHSGLSREDMRHMKYTTLVQTVWEWEDLNDPGSHSETRKATEDDWNFLKHM